VPDKALKYLNEAVNLGFNDMGKLQQDKFFESLENNIKSQEIIKLITNSKF
jgi:hypothetical protein